MQIYQHNTVNIMTYQHTLPACSQLGTLDTHLWYTQKYTITSS